MCKFYQVRVNFLSFEGKRLPMIWDKLKGESKTIMGFCSIPKIKGLRGVDETCFAAEIFSFVCFLFSTFSMCV